MRLRSRCDYENLEDAVKQRQTTIDERIEFLLQSAESHDRQIGELADQVSALGREPSALGRKVDAVAQAVDRDPDRISKFRDTIRFPHVGTLRVTATVGFLAMSGTS